MSRGLLIVACLAATGLLGPERALAQAIAVPQFSLETVAEKARALAQERMKPPPALRADIKSLTYEQFREIRFRPEKSLWRSQALFEAQFFHLGFLYDRPVQINLVRAGVSSPLGFRTELFDYGKTTFKSQIPSTLGFAGFRLHHPLNTPAYFDELIAFLGSTYFRVLGREQQYGLSARGLAIDTALPKGEEFPFFSEFWLEEPAPAATEVTLYALLDSPSVTGAYQFVVRPGTNTTVDVTAHLFFRNAVEKVGIAPLTSMMLFSENRTRTFDDHRPEVHDSDGLLVQTREGEWIFRPLSNPTTLQVSAFIGESPRGFGFLQRDRDASHYGDGESHYQRRPSYWVTPSSPWGPGHVELVEIPSHKETDDNMVAYWVSAQPVKKGSELKLGYRISAVLDTPELSPAGRVFSTRTGSAIQPGARSNLPRAMRTIALEFRGEELRLLRAGQPVEAIVTASTGKVSEVVVQKSEDDKTWRVHFHFLPEGDRASDLRAFLRLRGQTLSETWTYLWSGE